MSEATTYSEYSNNPDPLNVLYKSGGQSIFVYEIEEFLLEWKEYIKLNHPIPSVPEFNSIPSTSPTAPEFDSISSNQTSSVQTPIILLPASSSTPVTIINNQNSESVSTETRVRKRHIKDQNDEENENKDDTSIRVLSGLALGTLAVGSTYFFTKDYVRDHKLKQIILKKEQCASFIDR